MTELPKDAEGKAIPFDTERLYAYDGEKQDVFSFTYYREKDKWEIETDSLIIDSTHLYLTKPDTTEQLIEDIKRAQDACNRNGNTVAERILGQHHVQRMRLLCRKRYVHKQDA